MPLCSVSDPTCVFCVDGPFPRVSLPIRTWVSLSLFPFYHLLFGSRPRWSRLVPHARAEADTGEDAGSKYVKEGESFCQTTDARCNGEKLASDREQKRHACLQTRKTTQRSEKTGREIFYYNRSAWWREWLQPDQSRRSSVEFNREQGTRRRLSVEG